ncbi:bifunctional oligoribonuclease/PAP phosphatase NrnA [Candidatus Latescibacterota bacterium]
MVYFSENCDDWGKIASLIKRAETIYISTHVNPDGDAVGSVMALAGYLVRTGKPVRIINQSETPESYRFLDPDGIIESYPDSPPQGKKPGKNDLVFFLDFGNLERVGSCVEFLTKNDAPLVVIDHHPPESIEADVIVINTHAASTGSLLYDLMCHIDSSIMNKEIATALLTAVVTDTGYFRYSNTTATTHLITSSLYNYGVTASEIRKHLENGYQLCRQLLLGMALSTVRISPCGRIAYAHITESMFKKAGAKREHTDGIIDHIRVIRNIKIAALFIQEGKDRFKVSFRSGDGTSVNTIARLLKGGGHPKAAGASLTGSLEYVIKKVLEAAEELLNS